VAQPEPGHEPNRTFLERCENSCAACSPSNLLQQVLE
jgi:hypothetical protein